MYKYVLTAFDMMGRAKKPFFEGEYESLELAKEAESNIAETVKRSMEAKNGRVLTRKYYTKIAEVFIYADERGNEDRTIEAVTLKTHAIIDFDQTPWGDVDLENLPKEGELGMQLIARAIFFAIEEAEDFDEVIVNHPDLLRRIQKMMNNKKAIEEAEKEIEEFGDCTADSFEFVYKI